MYMKIRGDALGMFSSVAYGREANPLHIIIVVPLLLIDHGRTSVSNSIGHLLGVHSELRNLLVL